MANTGERLAKALLQPINPAIIIVLAAYTVVWGLWVISPFWSVFATAPVYMFMSALAAEFVWGAIAIVCGLLMAHGALAPSYQTLTRGALIGFLHWLIISIFYFAADWASTGGISAVAFAVYSLLIYVNVKVNKTYFKGLDGR